MVRDIKDYEGKYTIDDEGNVYSKGKFMKPYKINSGYLVINLWKHNKKKHFLVHRLVAATFLEGTGEVVDHIDGNRLNNAASNLRYCTQKENLYFHGFAYNSGTNHYKSYLSSEEIKQLRDLYKSGMRQCEIHRMFPNIPQNTIQQIVTYKTHKEIPC